MLEVLKDDKGNLRACCEWWLVNSDGSFNERGNYVWIAELEINPSERFKGLIRYFIKVITDKTPWTRYGYFWRKTKYPDRAPKMYSRRQWLKFQED